MLVFDIVAVFNIYVCLALCPRKIPPEVQERSALGRSTTRVIEITKKEDVEQDQSSRQGISQIFYTKKNDPHERSKDLYIIPISNILLKCLHSRDWPQ